MENTETTERYTIVENETQKPGEAFFHVHADGCADLTRGKRYAEFAQWGYGETGQTADQVVARVDGRLRYEVGYPEGWKVFPCCGDATRALRARVNATETLAANEREF